MCKRRRELRKMWSCRMQECDSSKLLQEVYGNICRAWVGVGVQKDFTGLKHKYDVDIKLFYVTNLVERKEVMIEYCHTDEMMADFFTKHWLVKSLEKTRERSWIMHPSSETVGVCWSTKRFHRIEVQVCQHRKGYESAKMLYSKEE